MRFAYAWAFCLFINTLGKYVDLKKHEFRRFGAPLSHRRFPWKNRDVPKLVQYMTLPPKTHNNTYEIVAQFLQEMEYEKSTPSPVNLRNVFTKWRRDRIKEVVLNKLVKMNIKEEKRTTERNKMLNKNLTSEKNYKDLRTYQPFENDMKLRHRTITIKKEGMILPMFKTSKHWEAFDKTENSVPGAPATDSVKDEKNKTDPYDNAIDFVFLYPGATKFPKPREILLEDNFQVFNTTNTPQPVKDNKDKLHEPRALLKAMFPNVIKMFKDETNNKKEVNVTESNQTNIKINSREWIRHKLAMLRRHSNNSYAKWRNGDRVLEYTLPNRRNKVEIKPITISKLRSKRQVIQNISDISDKEDKTNYLETNEVKGLLNHTPLNNDIKIVSQPKIQIPKMSLTQNPRRHEKRYNVTLADILHLIRKQETTLKEILQILKKMTREKNDTDLKFEATGKRFDELKAIMEAETVIINKSNDTDDLNDVFESQMHIDDTFPEPSIRQAHFDKKLVQIANRIIKFDNKQKHTVYKRDLQNDEDVANEISNDSSNDYDTFNENADGELYKSNDDLMITNAVHEEFEVKGFFKPTTTMAPTTKRKIEWITTDSDEISWATASTNSDDMSWTTVTSEPRTKHHMEKYRYYWAEMTGTHKPKNKITSRENTLPLTDYSKRIRTMLGKTFTIRRKMHHRDKKYQPSQQKLDSDDVHRVEVIVYGKIPGTNQSEVKPVQKFTVFNNKHNKHYKLGFSKENLLSHPQIRKFLPFDPKYFVENVSETTTISSINKTEDTTPVTSTTTSTTTTTPTPIEYKTTEKVVTTTTVTTPKVTATRTTTPHPTPTVTTTITTITTPSTTTKEITHSSLPVSSTVAMNTISSTVIMTSTASTISNLTTIPSNLTTVTVNSTAQPFELRMEPERVPIYREQPDTTIKTVTEVIERSLNDDFMPGHTEVQSTTQKTTPTAVNLTIPLYQNNITNTFLIEDRKKTTFENLPNYPYLIEKSGKSDLRLDKIRNEMLTSNQLIDLWVHHKSTRRNSVIGGVWPLELWKTIHLKNLKKTTTPAMPSIPFSKIKLENEEFYEYFDDEYAVRRRRDAAARILCTIIRKSQEEHMVHHIKNTWGKRCDILLFISSKKAETRSQWEFVLAGLQFVYNGYHDVEWIVKADVSTYIVVENLLVMLKGRNHKKPLYFGRPSYMDYQSFILSKEGLDKLATRGPKTIECQYVQEVGIRPCLDNVGVKEINPVDQYRRALFYPFGPFLWDPNEHRLPEEALKTWSDYAVSFNNLTYQDLYTMEYFIYHMNPLQVPEEYVDRVRHLHFNAKDKKRQQRRNCRS